MARHLQAARALSSLDGESSLNSTEATLTGRLLGAGKTPQAAPYFYNNTATDAAMKSTAYFCR